jgi:prolyl 4-hydroxylase
MGIELNDFIQVHDNVLEPEVCQFLINLFETNQDKHDRVENNKKPSFTQFNLTANCKINNEIETIHNLLISKTIQHRNNYYEFVDKRVFPEKHSFEQFRLKRYNNDENDEFDTHVDVMDYTSARRYLAFLWYLNDVNDGGETLFVDKSIRPKVGTLLIFPPLWMFPHKGTKPISNPKYILSTYLHYN